MATTELRLFAPVPTLGLETMFQEGVAAQVGVEVGVGVLVRLEVAV
jgi:hypothetical protein